MAEEVLNRERGKKITARGDTDGESKSCGQLLRHQNRVSVGDGDGSVQLRQIYDRGDELVRDTLDAMISHLATCAQYRGLGRLDRVDLDRWVDGTEMLSDTHDRSASPHSCGERMWYEAYRGKLGHNLRPRPLTVRFNVGGVGELLRKKDVVSCCGEFIGKFEGAEKTALLSTHQHDLSTIA